MRASLRRAVTHYQKKAAHEKANRKEPGGVKANQASTEESIAENELKKSRKELENQLEELEKGRGARICVFVRACTCVCVRVCACVCVHTCAYACV